MAGRSVGGNQSEVPTKFKMRFFGSIDGAAFTVELPRQTARRAATIEPTMQNPITNVRVVRNKTPSNPTVLSSISHVLVSVILVELRLKEQTIYGSLKRDDDLDSSVTDTGVKRCNVSENLVKQRQLLYPTPRRFNEK